MISEVGKVVAKEVIKETSKEVVKTAGGPAIDIKKRIDVTQKTVESVKGKVDTKKRITPSDVVKSIADVAINEIKEVIDAYLMDLKAKSEFASTLKDVVIDIKDLKLQPKEVVKELRKEFEKNKEKLIKEWEKQNNKEWPRYKEDIVNDKGVVVRKAGDYYDAHHIHPLCLGGKNVASNITPLEYGKHVDIHRKFGSCTKLIDLFKKGA